MVLAVVGGGAYLAASKAPVPIAGPQTTTTTPALGVGTPLNLRLDGEWQNARNTQNTPKPAPTTAPKSK